MADASSSRKHQTRQIKGALKQLTRTMELQMEMVTALKAVKSMELSPEHGMSTSSSCMMCVLCRVLQQCLIGAERER